jgi:hypothetical protein
MERKLDVGAASIIYNTMCHKNKTHGIIAAARDIHNATPRSGDGLRQILRQRV